MPDPMLHHVAQPDLRHRHVVEPVGGLRAGDHVAPTGRPDPSSWGSVKGGRERQAARLEQLSELLAFVVLLLGVPLAAHRGAEPTLPLASASAMST
eukprot:8062840-Alexandrium_andersonii.AAC.1